MKKPINLIRLISSAFILLTIILFVACQDEELSRDEKIQQLATEFNLQKTNLPNTKLNKFNSVEDARKFLLDVQSFVPKVNNNLKNYRPSTAKTEDFEGDPMPCSTSYSGGMYTYTYDGYTSDYNVSYNPSNGSVSSNVSGFTWGLSYTQTNYSVQNQGNNVVITTTGYVTAGIDVQGVPLSYSENVTIVTTYNTQTGGCTMQNTTPK